MKRSLVLLALMWGLAACESDKETTNPVPETLAGTSWTATTQEGNPVSLLFDAESYTLEQYGAYDGAAQQTDAEEAAEPVVRTYRYVRPHVELLEDAAVMLAGEIAADGKSQPTMTLQNADKSVTLNLVEVKK